MSMRSVVHSTDLNEVIHAIGRLSPEDAERIALPWLETGIRVTSRDRKATVKFGATLNTYTDLNTRCTVLSPMPLDGASLGYGRQSAYLIILGFAFHEAGHLRFSDETHAAIVAKYEKTKDLSLALTFSNLLDDERLERNLINDYAGTREAIKAARQYMSGSYASKGKQHPKQANFPRELKTKQDAMQTIVLTVAYSDYVAKPWSYGMAETRKLWLYVRRVMNDALKLERAQSLSVVDSHLLQVEKLIRAYKRYAKGLPNKPEPEPKPEPETTDSDELGEDEGEGGWEPSIDDGDESSEPGDEVDEDATGPEGDAGDEDAEGDEADDAESDEGEASKGGSSESEDEGETKSEGEGQGEPKDDESDGEPSVDVHAPGGRGGNGASDEKALEEMAEQLNEKLDALKTDPFVHDKDIMSDGELTGTIDRNVDALERSWKREVGDGDPYLTDTMREAFLSTRFSREKYSTGFTRGRLRTRDACKAPAGVANLFSQRSDSSVTRVRLTIMLDYSGSMTHIVQRSDTFFRSLADATQHIGAVRISAWTYDSNDLTALWESNEGEHQLAERLGQRSPGGGTGTATCLSMLTEEVERTALPGERQVILSITDGAPNEPIPTVRRVVEEARDLGIAVLGVNIGNDHPRHVDVIHRHTVQQYGDDAVAWNAGPEAWSDLGDEVLTMVGEVLAGARTF